MKKLLIALLVCLTLFGCGSKKVEYELIGVTNKDGTRLADDKLGGSLVFEDKELSNGTLNLILEDDVIEISLYNKTLGVDYYSWETSAIDGTKTAICYGSEKGDSLYLILNDLGFRFDKKK